MFVAFGLEHASYTGGFEFLFQISLMPNVFLHHNANYEIDDRSIYGVISFGRCSHSLIRYQRVTSGARRHLDTVSRDLLHPVHGALIYLGHGIHIFI